MKITRTLLLSSLLMLAGDLGAQIILYSSNVPPAAAIRAASALEAGMRQEDVEEALAGSGLTNCFGVGSGGGWSLSYGLADSSSLVLRYSARALVVPWGRKGSLEAAIICSNRLNIATIKLKNTQTSGDGDRRSNGPRQTGK
jgi:hypothetical protein